MDMKVTTLVPWFGSNRMLAATVGRQLAGCAWVAVPFAGGMSEVPHIGARTLLVNDLHRHLINLARTVADPVAGPKLYRRLRRRLFHPDDLARAQARCRAREHGPEQIGQLFGGAWNENAEPQLDWAEDYFVAAWMSRSGVAGTGGEFTGGLAVRYNAGGGDSVVRFQNAARGLVAWRREFRRCQFTTEDAFAVIERRVKDADGTGVYCDPPFPGPGDAYAHTFGEDGQRRLARLLAGFTKARVVARFYDHPLIRELYPEGRWRWLRQAGRKQTNDAAPEVLIVNGAIAGEVAA
jgi:site-specific DNA-adenine methylase